MSTAIAARISQQEIVKINEAASECRTALQQAAGEELAGCLMAAAAMDTLRNCLTPAVMASVAALQGSAMGFKTDRDGKGGYKSEELKDFALEAAVRGFRLIGNECNVIAGRFYGCKAGFERLVKNFPGLTDFADAYDIMETIGGNAKVQCIATFKLDGIPQKLARQKENTENGVFDNRISVRVNQGMGPDAIEGKAKRKFWAWIYDRLMGFDSDTPEGEAGDADGETPRKEMIPMFSGGPVKDATPPEDDGCPLIVAEYRKKLAEVQARQDIGKLMAMAGRDQRLTAKGKQAVATIATEASKLWPNKIDGGSDESEPAFNPPTPEEVARHGNQNPQQPATGRTPQPEDENMIRERDSRVEEYLGMIKQVAEVKDGMALGKVKALFIGDGVVNYHAGSMDRLKKAFNAALRTIQN